MRLYISGPMIGLPEYNYPAFARARVALQSVGFEVLSPHRVEKLHPPVSNLETNLQALWLTTGIAKPDEESCLWRWYTRRALGQLLCCDGLVQLAGWENSRGARDELDIATEILDLPVGDLEHWLIQAQLVQVPNRAP